VFNLCDTVGQYGTGNHLERIFITLQHFSVERPENVRNPGRSNSLQPQRYGKIHLQNCK